MWFDSTTSLLLIKSIHVYESVTEKITKTIEEETKGCGKEKARRCQESGVATQKE